MKLVKLSLATALAAGTLATASFATPLEEAIKDIDVGGSVMLRYDYLDGDIDSDSKWKFKGVLNFKANIADNFFAVAGLKIDDTDKGKGEGRSNPSREVELYNAYLGYTAANTTFLVGRQDAGTFFTDDLYGDGIKVVNSDIEGLTLAALWLDNFNEDGDIGSYSNTVIVNEDNKDEKYSIIGASTGKEVVDHDLFGVAAIGSYDPVSFQLWYARLAKVTDLYAAELGFNFDLGDGANLGLKGQYGHSDFAGGFKKDLGDAVADGDFYGIQAILDVSGFELGAGYVDFSTKSHKLSLNSFEDKGAFISAGEQINNDYSLYTGKNKMWFVTANFDIQDSGFSIGADYAELTNKDGVNPKYDFGTEELTLDEVTDKVKSKEIVGRIGYAYSKKLKFSSYYSHLKEGDAKQDKIRFQAKYSF